MNLESNSKTSVCAELEPIFALWSRLKASSGCPPQRKDLDPLDLPPKAWPFIALVGVEFGPRFKFTLVGTHIAHGIDPTGRFLDEAAPEGGYKAHILSIYTKGWNEAPLYTVTDYKDGFDNSCQQVHRMFLPMSRGQGSEPDMMIVGQMSTGLSPSSPSLWQVTPPSLKISTAPLNT